MNLIKRYIFWTYERGSFHYDVMVTLILAFLFITPFVIDYKDKPAPDVLITPHEVLVRPAGSQGSRARFVYEVRKDSLRGASDEASIRTALLGIIQPVAGGSVTLTGYQPVVDTRGEVVAYDATVLR